VSVLKITMTKKRRKKMNEDINLILTYEQGRKLFVALATSGIAPEIAEKLHDELTVSELKKQKDL